MTAALERGECSAARPGRKLPSGKTRYPFCRRLGGPQDRSGRAENLVPTAIRSRTVQPVVSRCTDWGTRPTFQAVRLIITALRWNCCRAYKREIYTNLQYSEVATSNTKVLDQSHVWIYTVEYFSMVCCSKQTGLNKLTKSSAVFN